MGDEIATIAQSWTRIHGGAVTSFCSGVSLIPVVLTNRGAPCCAETGAPVAGGGGPHPAVVAHPAANSTDAPSSNPNPFGRILAMHSFLSLPSRNNHNSIKSIESLDLWKNETLVKQVLV
jgi:hypothetical protein